MIDGVGALERPAGDIKQVVDKRPLDGLDRSRNAGVKGPFSDFRQGVSRHLASGSIAQSCNDLTMWPAIAWRATRR